MKALSSYEWKRILLSFKQIEMGESINDGTDWIAPMLKMQVEEWLHETHKA